MDARRIALAAVAAVALVAPHGLAAPAPQATFHVDGVVAHTKCPSAYQVVVYGDSTDGGLWRFLVAVTRGASAPCGPSGSVTAYVGSFDPRKNSCLAPVGDDGMLCLKPSGTDLVPLAAVDGGAWRVDICAVGECYRGDTRGAAVADVHLPASSRGAPSP